MYGLLIRLGVRAVRLAVDAEYRAKMFPPEVKPMPQPQRSYTEGERQFIALLIVGGFVLLLMVCAKASGLG